MIGKLAIACVLAQFATVFLIFIDNMMAGRHGPQTLAAFGVATQIIIPILILSMGFFFAINSIVATLYGKKLIEEINVVISTCFYMALISSIICIALLNNIEPLLDFFAIKKELYPGIKGYLGNISYGIFPYLLFLVLRFTSEGLLKSKYVMYCAISAIPVKVLLNLLFIYGALGFEGEGASGMGKATALTWTFMLLILLTIMLRNKNIKQLGISISVSRFSRKVCLEIIKVGGPIAFSMGIGVIFMSITGLMIGSISAHAIAAHQSAFNFVTLISMLFQGITVAVTSRVAYLNGANKTGNIPMVINIAIAMVISVALLNACILLFNATLIGKIYSHDTLLISMIANLLFWGALLQVPQALQEVAAAVLRGFKITLQPTIIYSATFSGSLIVGYFLSTHWQFEESGYWMAIVLANILTAIGLFYMLFVKFHKATPLISQQVSSLKN
ncbi:MAG: MATE family efflux transporter [Algicola sp.]|nr:MATE family efflux transporter [Algicola sp.]